MDYEFIKFSLCVLVAIISLIAIPLIIKLISGKNPYTGDKPKCIYCNGKKCFYCLYTGVKQIGQGD